MKFYKLALVGAILMFSNALSALELGDTSTTTMLLTSRTGDLDLCTDQDFIGTISTNSDFLNVNTSTGIAEFFRFNTNNGTTATYKSYLARNNVLMGTISASFVRRSNNDPGVDIFNEYQFSGILNTDN